MKIVSYLNQGRPSYGVVRGEDVLELSGMGDAFPTKVRDALALDLPSLIEEQEEQLAVRRLSELEFLPVIPDSSKIVCVGVNYVDHRDEAGRTAVNYPTLFTRFPDTQVGHGQPVKMPRASSMLDYEGELAVIIGKSAFGVSADDALEYVAGYSCYNDLSVRDWQRHTSQWTPGKNFLGVGSFGPWLTTSDELRDLEDMHLETRVNGEIRQSAPISEMIFSVPQLIEYISTFTPLDVGDVIVSGTPGGVGFFRDPPLFLVAGDVVEVEITGVGLLRTPIV